VDARFCLVFPRETISVPVVRRVLGEALDQIGVDQECIADLLLAVTEACTNVLKHSGPGFRYEVTASVGPHSCVLEVVDNGRGFGRAALRKHVTPIRSVPVFRRRRPAAQWPFPSAAAPSTRRHRLPMLRSEEERALARLPESGRGLAIMRACVDDVTLRSRRGRGTVVSLQKRIELRSDAPLTHPEGGREPERGAPDVLGVPDVPDVLSLRDAG
jgi:serine/threonine-protein kinase RsbW